VTTNRARATGALAAALIVATPFIAAKEGKRNNPYLDTVGVMTVCYGETRVPMRRYSDAECLAQFNKALGEDFGPAVLRCTPGIADRPRVLASAVSLAYNIGVSGYCRSTAARKFNAGDIRGGCNAFMLWNRPREIIGRRMKERDLCLSGAA
jgi:lysozyme